MPELISGIASPSRTGAHLRANELIAAIKLSAQADSTELQRVAIDLDQPLFAQAADVIGLIYEYQPGSQPFAAIQGVIVSRQWAECSRSKLGRELQHEP